MAVDIEETSVKKTYINKDTLKMLVVDNSSQIPQIIKNKIKDLKEVSQKYSIPFKLSEREKLNSLSKGIVGSDDLRVDMNYIYCFGGFMMFTDAHTLISIPTNSEFKGSIDPTKIVSDNKVEAGNLNWKIDSKDDKNKLEQHPFFNVIPKYNKENLQGKVDLIKLYSYLNFITQNSILKGKSNLPISFKYSYLEDKNISINAFLVLKLVSAFMQMGINNAYLYASTPTRPLILSENEIDLDKNNAFFYGKKCVIGLIMPVINIDIPNEYCATYDIDYNFEMNIIYNLTNNKVYNKKGDIDDYLNSGSGLNINEFDINFSDFKKNYATLKKESGNTIIEILLGNITDGLYENIYEGKSKEELSVKEDKLLLSLNWLNLFNSKI